MTNSSKQSKNMISLWSSPWANEEATSCWSSINRSVIIFLTSNLWYKSYLWICFAAFFFCFILFYFILFYFILFYFILFYFILFYFILFYFILFYFILFYFILFYFILFYFILFYFILFYFIRNKNFGFKQK